jgi:hypothetical protein
MLSPATGGRDREIDLIVGTGFLVQDHEHLRSLLARLLAGEPQRDVRASYALQSFWPPKTGSNRSKVCAR